MINQKPILIAGCPRSGTTMLAGLLHYHGVWVGRSRTTMYPGSNSNFGSENLDIKEIMKQEGDLIGYKHKNWSADLPIKPQTDTAVLKKAIEAFVPHDQPWLVKTSWTLIFYEFWKEAYPDAYWIFPYREEQSILDSMDRHPGMAKRFDKVKRDYVTALMERQIDVRLAVRKHFQVDVKKVSQMNLSQITWLFDFLDMKVSKEVIYDWIEPELMS